MKSQKSTPAATPSIPKQLVAGAPWRSSGCQNLHWEKKIDQEKYGASVTVNYTGGEKWVGRFALMNDSWEQPIKELLYATQPYRKRADALADVEARIRQHFEQQ